MDGRFIYNFLWKIIGSIIILLILVLMIIIVTIGMMIIVPIDIFEFMIKKKMTFSASLKTIRDILNDWTNEQFARVANSLIRLWS